MMEAQSVSFHELRPSSGLGRRTTRHCVIQLALVLGAALTSSVVAQESTVRQSAEHRLRGVGDSSWVARLSPEAIGTHRDCPFPLRLRNSPAEDVDERVLPSGLGSIAWCWGQALAPPAGSWLVLRDRSRLAGQWVESRAEGWVWQTRYWGRITVPREQIVGAILRPALGLEQRSTAWGELQTPRSTDRLWWEPGRWLDGRIGEGKLWGGEGPALAVVDREGRPLELPGPWLTLEAVRLQAAPDDEPSPARYRWQVAFDDGSVLRVQQVAWGDERVELGLEAGLRLEQNLETAGGWRAWQAIAQIPAESVRWDLEAAEQEGQVGNLSRNWLATGGRAVDGQALAVAGEWLPEGRAQVGATTWVFAVPDGCQSVGWTVGVDDRSPTETAQVKVFVAQADGVWLEEPLWQAELQRGAPREVGEVAGKGVNQARYLGLHLAGPEPLGVPALVVWDEVWSRAEGSTGEPSSR